MRGRIKPDTIVFVNQSSGYLMIDIVNSFMGNYSKRILLTGFLNRRNRDLDTEVKVVKIVTYKRSSLLSRMLAWPIGFLQALFLIKLKYRSAHLFLVSNPPLMPLLPIFCNNPFSLLIYDVYPDIIYQNGLLSKESLLVKLWQKANKKVYSKAAHIFTITEGMQDVLIKYAGETPIKVVPIWTDNDYLKPMNKKDNSFLRSNNLQDQFVVIYSGNIGDSQNVEVIIELASRFRTGNIKFVIVGQGTNMNKIENLITANKLTNCMLFPWQNQEIFPHVLAAADIAVVTLSEKASQLGIPSKFYNYLSVGAPVLSIAGKDSDLEKVVNKYEVGKSFQPEDINGMYIFVKHLYEFPDQKHKYSNNSFKASIDFSPSNATHFL